MNFITSMEWKTSSGSDRQEDRDDVSSGYCIARGHVPIIMHTNMICPVSLHQQPAIPAGEGGNM